MNFEAEQERVSDTAGSRTPSYCFFQTTGGGLFWSGWCPQTFKNQSLIREEIVLLIIQYPFLTVISSHCMFDVNPFIKLGTFAVIKHFVLLWPKLKFKEICCPGWIITKWVSFVHTCKVHISKKLYRSFQSNLINVFYRTRKLISAAKLRRKFEYIIHIRNLKWIHRKHWMRIRFVHYKLIWMQEKGAVLFQLILHIEAGGDYHTSVKYESVPVFTSRPGTASNTFGISIHPVQLSACSDAGVWVSAYYSRDLYSWIYWWNLFLVCFCALPASFCQESAVLPFKTASSSSSDKNQLQGSQGRRETIQNTGSSSNLHC